MAQTYNQPTGDFVTTTLNGAISAGATTATIGTGLNLPATNGIIMADYDSLAALGATSGPETIIYASYTSGTGALTGLTRGSGGTTGVAHSNAASVCAAPSILYLNDLYNGNLAAASSSVGVPAASIRQEPWTTWSSSLTGWSGTPTQSCRYIQYGKTIHAKFDINGTSNSTSTAFALPVAAKEAYRALLVAAIDNNVNLTSPALLVLTNASTSATVYKDGNLSAWTGSSTKAVFGQITYEAN